MDDISYELDGMRFLEWYGSENCRPNPERKAYEAYVRMVAPICEKTRDSVPLCKDVAVDVSLAVREGREWLCIQGRVGMQTVRHLHALAFEDGLVWLVCKSKIECRHTEVCDILGVRTDARIRDVLVCCLEAVLNLPQWRGVV